MNINNTPLVIFVLICLVLAMLWGGKKVGPPRPLPPVFGASLSEIPGGDDSVAPTMLPGLAFDVEVMSPEQIKRLGFHWNRPDALGMATRRQQKDGSWRWTIFVPPMFCDPGDWVWCHEIRHVQEGGWHD